MFCFFLEGRVFSLIEKCSFRGLQSIWFKQSIKAVGLQVSSPGQTGFSLHLPLRLPNSQAREAKVLNTQQIYNGQILQTFCPPSSALGFMIIKSECYAEVIDSTVIGGLDLIRLVKKTHRLLLQTFPTFHLAAVEYFDVNIFIQ